MRNPLAPIATVDAHRDRFRLDGWESTGSALLRRIRAMAPTSAVIASLSMGMGGTPARAQETVYLDFDSETDPTDFQYSQDERDEIQARLEAHYYAFPQVLFVQSADPFYDRKVIFNADSAVTTQGGCSFDFLNDYSGLHICKVNFSGTDTSDRSVVVRKSANTATHELGHSFGLSHLDGVGPLGSGLHPSGGAGRLQPEYPGPFDAIETGNFFMLGAGFTDKWFSERSALKLAFNLDPLRTIIEEEEATPHDSVATAQPVTFQSISAPNTIVSGANAGVELNADVLAITGVVRAGESVYFSFVASRGDRINVHALVSSSSDRRVRLLDGAGNPVDYYGTDAESFSASGFDGFGSVAIVDLPLPADDEYFLEVTSFQDTAPNLSGVYKLWVTKMSPGDLPLLSEADLYLAPIHAPASVELGQTISYRLFFGNNGPHQASNAVLRATLDPSMTLESASTTVGSCTFAPSASGGRLECPLGNLASDSLEAAAVRATPTQAGLVRAIQARVESATPDPGPSTNEESAETEVIHDEDPPLCTDVSRSVTTSSSFWPESVQVRIQDAQSGLAAIDVVQTENVRISLPSFTPGSTDPVYVSGRQMYPSRPFGATLQVSDVAGNVTTCSLGSSLGDLNGDRVVDGLDLALLEQALGSSQGDRSFDADADLDGDGSITKNDWLLLKSIVDR